MRYEVLQVAEGLRNHIGEMSETQVCAHVATRAGYEMAEIDAMLSELEINGKATVEYRDSVGIKTLMHIRSLS
jgi:hypothetical protein